MRDPFGYASWYRVAPRDARVAPKLGEGVKVLDTFRHAGDSLATTEAQRRRYVWREAQRSAPDAPMRATVPYSRRLNIVADEAAPTVTRMEWTSGALHRTERRHRNRARRKGR